MSEPHRNEQAEKALRERDRLYRHYRQAKRSYRQNLYAEHPMGWRLREFSRQLNRFKLPDAAAFLTYVQEENRSWLLTAPPDIRAEALSLVNERIMRIRQAHGLLPLDDPIPSFSGRAEGEEAPGDEDSIWLLCRRELTYA